MKTDSQTEKHDERKVLDKREDHQNERKFQGTTDRWDMTAREIRAFNPHSHEADSHEVAALNDPGHPGQAPPVHSDPQPAQRGRPASAVTGEPIPADLVKMTSKPLQHLPSGHVCRLSIELPDDIRAVHYEMIQGWLDSCVEILARSLDVFRLERPSGSAP